MIINSKRAAIEAIARTGDKNNLQLVKIPLSEKDKYIKHEMWYQHELYDVVKKEVANDSVYIYLYHDNDEENILSEIAGFFQCDVNNNYTAFPGCPVLKSMHTITDLHYLFFALQLLLKPGALYKKLHTNQYCALSTTAHKVNIPPPKS
jgi:hypothetical protein